MAVPSRHRPRLSGLARLSTLAAPDSERLGAVSARDVRPFAEPRPRFFAGDDGGWTGRMLGLFMAGIWLVFLSDAFTVAWQQRETVRGDGGIIVLVLFVVLYLVHFSHLRYAVWGTRGSTATHWYVTRVGLVYWAALAVLSVLAVVTIGQEGASTWVFLAVSGLWTFRVPVGLVIGVALVGLYEFL